MTRKQTRHPKALSDLPIAVQEGLCIIEAYRRLGFSAGDVYAGLGPTQNPPGGRAYQRGPRAGQPVPDNSSVVIIVLRTQDLEFAADYPDDSGMTMRQFVRTWKNGVKLWNQSTDAEANVLWRQSWALAISLDFVIGLLDKGFIFPISPDLTDPEQAMRLFSPPPAEA